METSILDSIQQAFHLLISLDGEVYLIAYTSLIVALSATFVASFIGIPLAIFIHTHRFPFKRVVVAIVNSLTALPTVLVGLFVYYLLSNMGPLGDLHCLFTPQAIIVGLTILVVPIIVSVQLSGLTKLDIRLLETVQTLGARPYQIYLRLIRESHLAILFSILTGFGRVIGEVGIAMMLGGNIKGFTRTLTTAIALETSKGEFILGIALGIILMVIALSISFILHFLFRRTVA